MDRTSFLAVAVATVVAQIGVAAMVIGVGFGQQGAPVPSMDLGEPASHHGKHDPRSLTDTLFPDSVPSPATTPMALTMDRSVPVHLSIPRVGIDTSLLSLGLNPDGTLELPPDTPHSPAGWYNGLASPGEVGPAVIVGHLDAPDAQAVFFNLGALHAGDHIWVTREDHSVAEFTVRESGLYPKESFPTEAVYGPSDVPVLRLITCGGAYSPAGYTQNVVVFAALTGIETEPERDALTGSADTTAPAPSPSPTETSTLSPTAESDDSEDSHTESAPVHHETPIRRAIPVHHEAPVHHETPVHRFRPAPEPPPEPAPYSAGNPYD